VHGGVGDFFVNYNKKVIICKHNLLQSYYTERDKMKNRINKIQDILKQIKPQKIGAAITVMLFGLICAIGGYELRSSTDGASSPLPVSKGGTGGNNFPANTVLTGNGPLSFGSLGVDPSPSPSSSNIVRGGGVYDALHAVKKLANVPLNGTNFAGTLVIMRNANVCVANGDISLRLALAAGGALALTTDIPDWCVQNFSNRSYYAGLTREGGSADATSVALNMRLGISGKNITVYNATNVTAPSGWYDVGVSWITTAPWPNE
jgi:hypothetical protein